MGMTIMDKINEHAAKKGIAPVTGSIADVINNLVSGEGGVPTGGSIADALDKLNEVSSIEY